MSLQTIYSRLNNVASAIGGNRELDLREVRRELEDLADTHACQECGFLWAPAVVPTVGVRFLPGCKGG